MSVVINGTGSISGLSNVGGIASAQSGSVIQTVTSSPQTSTSYTTSTTFVTSGLSLSITPQFSTSKILVLANTTLDNQAGTGVQMFWTIYRGGSNLLDSGSNSGNGFGGVYTASSRIQVATFGSLLDSPATTSSTTYTLYFRTGGGNVGFNASTSCLITLMEIAS